MTSVVVPELAHEPDQMVLTTVRDRQKKRQRVCWLTVLVNYTYGLYISLLQMYLGHQNLSGGTLYYPYRLTIRLNFVISLLTRTVT